MCVSPRRISPLSRFQNYSAVGIHHTSLLRSVKVSQGIEVAVVEDSGCEIAVIWTASRPTLVGSASGHRFNKSDQIGNIVHL